MKNIPFLDIIFIIVSSVILYLFNELGYSVLLSRYSVILVLIAYFIGKYIGKVETRKKIQE